MRRTRKPQPVVIMSEAFCGSDGLLRAINNAATKLLMEGSSLDLCGVEGRLTLTRDGGNLELKIDAR